MTDDIYYLSHGWHFAPVVELIEWRPNPVDARSVLEGSFPVTRARRPPRWRRILPWLIAVMLLAVAAVVSLTIHRVGVGSTERPAPMIEP